MTRRIYDVRSCKNLNILFQKHIKTELFTVASLVNVSKLALNNSSIQVNDSALNKEFAVFLRSELSFVTKLIRKSELTLTVWKAVLELSFVALARLHDELALTVANALFKLADVLISARSSLCALSMRHAVEPLSLEDASVFHREFAIS